MTDEFQSEFDLVFPLLASVEFGVGYNDNTGLRAGELNYYKEYSIPDVDGGGVDPYAAMREEFEAQIRADYEALMEKAPMEVVFTTEGVQYKKPDPEFKIRSAYMYRRILPLRDSYEFWLNIAV